MGRAFILFVFLSLVMGCGGKGASLDLHQLALQVQEATASVESYQFNGEWQFKFIYLDQTSDDTGSDILKGDGRFAAPDRLHIRYTSAEGLLDDAGEPLQRFEVLEVLYDGTNLFATDADTMEWIGSSRMGWEFFALQIAPSLGEVIGWTFRLQGVKRLPVETVDLIRRASYQVTQVQILPGFLGQDSTTTGRTADAYFHDYDAQITIEAPELR